MFDERPQNTNAVYAISDKPMTNDEWVKRYVTPHWERVGFGGWRPQVGPGILVRESAGL